jgi:hypothetical protein
VLEGEGNVHFDPIQLVWMVKETRSCGPARILFTIQARWMGPDESVMYLH